MATSRFDKAAALLLASPLIAAAPVSAPTTANAARPAPPAFLAPYIKAGVFDPGDYGWARGVFADALPADKARMEELKAYHAACFAAEAGRVARELAAAGATVAELPPAPYGDRTCGDTTTPFLGDDGYASWPAFQAALARARPIAATYVWAADVAGQAAASADGTLGERLRARPVTEQMLRLSMSWGEGNAAGAPILPPYVLHVVKALVSKELIARDHANAAWLKTIVDADGWPRLSAVGKPGAKAAWLLVQHADQDPAFQLRALRLMEPLVAAGEADRGDYAYLYDRIMLKVAGRQRYATQFHCDGGKFQPQPLEDAAGVERHRKDMGLGTLAEYRKMFDAMYGNAKC